MTTEKSRCEKCGSYAEKTPSGEVVQAHHFGCQNSTRASAAEPTAKKAAAKRTTKRSQ